MPRNPVLCFKTPRLPSAKTLSPEAFGERVYVSPMLIDRGTPELNRKLREDPSCLLPTAMDEESLLSRFPPEDRERMRTFLARRREHAKEIAKKVTPEVETEAWDHLQLSLPPGLRQTGWKPSKQTKKRLLAQKGVRGCGLSPEARELQKMYEST